MQWSRREIPGEALEVAIGTDGASQVGDEAIHFRGATFLMIFKETVIQC